MKGKFGWDYVNSEDRLTSPLIRDGDRFREATWDEALALVGLLTLLSCAVVVAAGRLGARAQ